MKKNKTIKKKIKTQKNGVKYFNKVNNHTLNNDDNRVEKIK